MDLHFRELLCMQLALYPSQALTLQGTTTTYVSPTWWIAIRARLMIVR